MDRLLSRAERVFGRFAIPRLAVYVVAGMAFMFAVGMVRPDILERLSLDPAMVPHEPWRLVTFLFLPTSMSLFWVFFTLAFAYFVGTSLEATWGTFKFNVYYLLGALGTIAGSYLTGAPASNYFLNESLFFALATLAPNHEIVFFVLPLRIKWLALFAAALIAFQFVMGGLGTRVAIGISFVNYFVFFSGHLVDLVRARRTEVRQAARRAQFDPIARGNVAPESRVCAICGARQADGADIRVCSCEKCGGPRELCLEHARNH